MSKLNLDLKIEVIHQFFSGRDKCIAKSLGMNHEVLRMWSKQYEYHGLKAFEIQLSPYPINY